MTVQLSVTAGCEHVPSGHCLAAPSTLIGLMLVHRATHCTRRIMDSLTEQQLDRYESFRRSSLARPKVKKVGLSNTDGGVVSAACSSSFQGCGS